MKFSGCRNERFTETDLQYCQSFQSSDNSYC